MEKLFASSTVQPKTLVPSTSGAMVKPALPSGRCWGAMGRWDAGRGTGVGSLSAAGRVRPKPWVRGRGGARGRRAWRGGRCGGARGGGEGGGGRGVGGGARGGRGGGNRPVLLCLRQELPRRHPERSE